MTEMKEVDISQTSRNTMHRIYINFMQVIRRFFWTGALFWFAPLSVFADDCPENKLCNPINFPNLTSFFLAIVNVVIKYGALLIVLMIVYAGFKFVVAQGNSEKVSEARKMLTWIVVGAFVLLGVYVIRAAICGTIGQLGVELNCEITQ